MTPKRYIFYSEMDFEYDPAKSRANQAKHGIDFAQAEPSGTIPIPTCWKSRHERPMNPGSW